MTPHTTGTTRTDHMLPRIALLSVLALLVACQARTPDQFATIQPGMSEQEVLRHLGKPSSTLQAPQTLNGTPATWAHRWHWGDTLSSSMTIKLFPDQAPPPAVGTVWFDTEGRVLSVQAPVRADSPQVTGPVDPWAEPAR